MKISKISFLILISLLLFNSSCSENKSIESKELKYFSHKPQMPTETKESSIKEAKKAYDRTVRKAQFDLVNDSIASLDSLFLNYFKLINNGYITLSSLDSNQFELLVLETFRLPNEQRKFHQRDSSVNVSFIKSDTSGLILYQGEIIHGWNIESWWMNYEYLGYCENGNYDWFIIGGDIDEHAIFYQDGSQENYPYIYSENKDFRFHIHSYASPSTYETSIVVDGFLETNLNNLIIKKAFWVDANRILFSLSQKRDTKELSDDQSNIRRTAYFMLEIMK